jgi:hypothetical protein
VVQVVLVAQVVVGMVRAVRVLLVAPVVVGVVPELQVLPAEGGAAVQAVAGAVLVHPAVPAPPVVPVLPAHLGLPLIPVYPVVPVEEGARVHMGWTDRVDQKILVAGGDPVRLLEAVSPVE